MSQDKKLVMNEYLVQRQEEIAANISRVRASLREAAERVGRDPESILLIAVSKTNPVELVKLAYAYGVSDFGENRVQEALPKIADFHPEGLRWHMIGHLQSNKAGKVVGAFDSVQSVDTLALAQTLERHAAKQEVRLPVLLEVNVAEEVSKAGMMLAEAPLLARQIAELPHLEIQGLMTIAPLVDDPEEVRPVFRKLRQLRDHLREDLPMLQLPHLSMGMTDDYRVAIEEGATIIRIGRAIFGERI